MSDRECLLAGVAIGLAAEVWSRLRDARFAESMALDYRRAAQAARASEEQYRGWLEECYGWLEERWRSAMTSVRTTTAGCWMRPAHLVTG